jgi:methylphosphotriester-DNA--protein-cysteine methyltransferase
VLFSIPRSHCIFACRMSRNWPRANVAFDVERRDVHSKMQQKKPGECRACALAVRRPFKQSTGVSPHHYVTGRRLDRAKSLLRETDQPIAEILQQLGYSAASHFCVSFQRYAGLTPRQYRRDPS